MANLVLKVDQEFKELIPPMAAEEYQQLRDNIVRDGCRDPIAVWDGVILDGYTRYRICDEEKIPFTTVEVRVADREEARKWMILNQLGKRNLRPGQISMLRGILYNSTKDKHGGSRKAGGPKNSKPKKTSESVAEQMGVTEKTVRSDGKFVEAVEKLESVDADIKDKVMSGEASKSAVIEAGKVVDKNPEKAKAILDGTDVPAAGELNSGLEKMQQSLKDCVDLLKKAFTKENVATLDNDGKQEAEMSVDAFLMKVEKLKDMLERDNG